MKDDVYENIDWISEFDFAMALQNTDQLNAAAQNLGLRSFPTGVGVQAGNTINVIQPTTVFMTLKDIPIIMAMSALAVSTIGWSGRQR